MAKKLQSVWHVQNGRLIEIQGVSVGATFVTLPNGIRRAKDNDNSGLGGYYETPEQAARSILRSAPDLLAHYRKIVAEMESAIADCEAALAAVLIDGQAGVGRG